MGCSPQDSSVHGIFQARILEYPFPSPGVLPYPEIEPGSPTLRADSLPSESPGKPIGLDIFNFGRTKRLINWGGKRQPFPEQAKLGSLYLWMLHISQLIFTNSFTNKEVNLPEWRNQEANGHGRSSGNQECGLAQTGYQWVKFPLLVNERTIVIIPPLTDYKETTS